MLLCLCCAGLRLWSLAYLDRSLLPATAGSLGVRMGAPDGPLWLRPVKSVQPGSDIALQGVKVGDQLSFVRGGDQWRAKGVDELIPVTVASGGQMRSLLVRTAPQPGRVTPLEVARQLGGLVESRWRWATGSEARRLRAGD